MEIYSRFNPPPSVDTTFEGESLTQQHFADECDINRIIENFARTGFLVDPTLPPGRSPQFGDFTDMMDFATAQQVVIDANNAFSALPSRIRDRFSNDPAQLLDFLSRKENFDEAVSLGLVDRRDESSDANSASQTE